MFEGEKLRTKAPCGILDGMTESNDFLYISLEIYLIWEKVLLDLKSLIN